MRKTQRMAVAATWSFVRVPYVSTLRRIAVVETETVNVKAFHTERKSMKSIGCPPRVLKPISDGLGVGVW